LWRRHKGGEGQKPHRAKGEALYLYGKCLIVHQRRKKVTPDSSERRSTTWGGEMYFLVENLEMLLIECQVFTGDMRYEKNPEEEELGVGQGASTRSKRTCMQRIGGLIESF
jgi:hypothetical protein